MSKTKEKTRQKLTRKQLADEGRKTRDFLDKAKLLRVEELFSAYLNQKALLDWLDPKVKELLDRTGSIVRVVRRDYHPFLGELLEARWELKSVDVGVYEKTYDQSEGKYYFEKKIIRLDTGGTVNFEFITERKPELAEGETIK